MRQSARIIAAATLLVTAAGFLLAGVIPRQNLLSWLLAAGTVGIVLAFVPNRTVSAFGCILAWPSSIAFSVVALWMTIAPRRSVDPEHVQIDRVFLVVVLLGFLAFNLLASSILAWVDIEKPRRPLLVRLSATTAVLILAAAFLCNRFLVHPVVVAAVTMSVAGALLTILEGDQVRRIASMLLFMSCLTLLLIMPWLAMVGLLTALGGTPGEVDRANNACSLLLALWLASLICGMLARPNAPVAVREPVRT